MNKRLIAMVMAVLMIGCSSEWRSQQPTVPITYKVPAYRSGRTVRNLMRLAILPVRRNQCGIFGSDCQPQPDDYATASTIANYLSESKGYKVKVVADEAGVWRPEVVVIIHQFDADLTKMGVTKEIKP